MRPAYFSCTILLMVPLLAGPAIGQGAGFKLASLDVRTTQPTREDRHRDAQWAEIAAHLPDPETATPAALELAADVLRARRLPEDALDYFSYAIKRGGDQPRLLNKMGITELELNQLPLAFAYFQRAVKLNKKSAEAWNNLGATEHLQQHYGSALSDYHRAVKLNGGSAVYHSNLGTAYFQQKDYSAARHEYEKALALDPAVFEHSESSGISAHVMSPNDRGRFCFEMARMQAKRGDAEGMLHWLAMAAEGGFDVMGELAGDPEMLRFRKDPQVIVVVQNGRALRNRNSVASSGNAVPPLPAATPASERQ